MKCLACYAPLPEGSPLAYHPACSKRFYGAYPPPELSYTYAELEGLAHDMVRAGIAAPGVQHKLSLDIDKTTARLTVLGAIGGHYILKPSTPTYPFLAENEDLTMHLAEIFGVETAQHTLATLSDGTLVYLTRRFDRTRSGAKVHQEDFCQLAEKLTENKYDGSLELIGRLIKRHVPHTHYRIAASRFWHLCVVCYLTGNADMHLKNFSLRYPRPSEVELAPAYDLVNTALALPNDNEEVALSLEGKKSKLDRAHFLGLGNYLALDPQQLQGILHRLSNRLPKAIACVAESFLPQQQQLQYVQILQQRAERLDLLV
ncbi:MAG: HipA domain-containing protein [Bacteroidia bacterium]|nr:HipA domain-containing protein [Bacteroidia bacterium]